MNCTDTLLLVLERVRLARLRRGLTQAALAERLGISHRILRKYESMFTSAELASKLGEILDYPPQYFVRKNPPEVESSALNFHAGRSTTKRQRDAAVSVGSSGVERDRWISRSVFAPFRRCVRCAG